MSRTSCTSHRAFHLALAMALLAACNQSALADTIWQWQYSGTGIEARGTLTTDDAADAEGFRLITAITGIRNGDLITGLYPTGSAIPGNEPYALDNLIRIDGAGQITVHGFGFATAGGGYANPFYADFLATPGYVEVFTTASSFSEVPISFLATAVPEPEAFTLMLAGLGMAAIAGRRRR